MQRSSIIATVVAAGASSSPDRSRASPSSTRRPAASRRPRPSQLVAAGSAVEPSADGDCWQPAPAADGAAAATADASKPRSSRPLPESRTPAGSRAAARPPRASVRREAAASRQSTPTKQRPTATPRPARTPAERRSPSRAGRAAIVLKQGDGGRRRQQSEGIAQRLRTLGGPGQPLQRRGRHRLRRPRQRRRLRLGRQREGPRRPRRRHVDELRDSRLRRRLGDDDSHELRGRVSDDHDGDDD